MDIHFFNDLLTDFKNRQKQMMNEMEERRIKYEELTIVISKLERCIECAQKEATK
jgi:hypothetical protein